MIAGYNGDYLFLMLIIIIIVYWSIIDWYLMIWYWLISWDINQWYFKFIHNVSARSVHHSVKRWSWLWKKNWQQKVYYCLKFEDVLPNRRDLAVLGVELQILIRQLKELYYLFQRSVLRTSSNELANCLGCIDRGKSIKTTFCEKPSRSIKLAPFGERVNLI